MKNKSAFANILESRLEDILGAVSDILEKEDGRTFEEKITDAIKLLEDEQNPLLKYVEKKGLEEILGEKITTAFWKYGKIIPILEGITLCRVEETDRENFYELQRENTILPILFEEDSFRNLLWQEHTLSTALICTVTKNGEYTGYCGIKNITDEVWEIVIELLRKWTHKGVGYTAMIILLNELKARLHVQEFRIRIDSDNYSSQRLFEKLGATPNGISEFILHDANMIKKCEEDNSCYIDNRLRNVAKKFNVEPKELLGHVLEYRLTWKGNR